jgi:2-haloacid dehalogenase
VERWATFDCYGTLVDWNAGIRAGLEHVFGASREDELLERYHELEPEIQAASSGASYREVLTVALERLAEETGLTLPEGEGSALARSLPGWPVFADVRPALGEARERGWRLAILSNTDRDLIDASMETIGVPFDLAVVASEIGSYKPAPRHWEVFREQTGADPTGHVHVAQSMYHDVAPASEFGIPTIWINRLGEPADPRPTRTLSSLEGLAAALDEVVSRRTCPATRRGDRRRACL